MPDKPAPERSNLTRAQADATRDLGAEATVKTLSVPIQPMLASLTMTVAITGRRRFALRCWLARGLMAVTAWVVGTKLDMSVDLKDDDA